MDLRRKLEGYVEPIGQGFRTFENAQIVAPSATRSRAAIDNAVNLQPHPGAMYVHSVPTQNNTITGSTPFVRM